MPRRPRAGGYRHIAAYGEAAGSRVREQYEFAAAEAVMRVGTAATAAPAGKACTPAECRCILLWASTAALQRMQLWQLSLRAAGISLLWGLAVSAQETLKEMRCFWLSLYGGTTRTWQTGCRLVAARATGRQDQQHEQQWREFGAGRRCALRLLLSLYPEAAARYHDSQMHGGSCRCRSSCCCCCCRLLVRRLLRLRLPLQRHQRQRSFCVQHLWRN